VPEPPAIGADRIDDHVAHPAHDCEVLIGNGGRPAISRACRSSGHEICNPLAYVSGAPIWRIVRLVPDGHGKRPEIVVKHIRVDIVNYRFAFT
jgi:hypothetical protein